MEDSNAGLRHILAVATELVKALEQSKRHEVIDDGRGDSGLAGVPDIRHSDRRVDVAPVQGNHASVTSQNILGKLDI